MTKNIVFTILWVSVSSLVLLALSYLGFLYPWINATCFFLITGVVFYLSFRRPELGIACAVTELIIGGKGYLFSIAIFDQAIPIRYVIFAILGLTWIRQIMHERSLTFIKTPFRWVGLALLIWIFVAAINGFIRNPHEVWFFDFNGYLYFIFALPLFQAIRNTQQLARVVQWGSGGLLALIVFTFFLGTLFATYYYQPNFVNATQIDSGQLAKLATENGEPAKLSQTTSLSGKKTQLDRSEVTPDRPTVYRWVRDTGTAEVSYFSGRIFRIFSISHLYVLLAFFPMTVWLLFTSRWRRERWLALVAVLLSAATLFVGFSRSFWFGLAIALLCMLILLPKTQKIRFVVGGIVLGILFLGLLPFIPGAWDASFGRLQSLFQPSTELAASNRLLLLPEVMEKIQASPVFGSGYGTLVSYQSLVAGTDDVENIAVYLYEWGYLDLMVKMGAVGLLLYLLFLSVIFYSGLRLQSRTAVELSIRIGVICSLAALVAAHTFTPYLNHPIGISAILLCALVFYLYRDQAKT